MTEAAKADEANEQLKAELLQAKKNLQNAKRYRKVAGVLLAMSCSF